MGDSYRDLKVWQKSIELSVADYQWTSKFPGEELYGLTSQLRRAAVSVASILAEGYGRASRGDFRRLVGVARGSILEVQTQIVIAREPSFGDPGRAREIQEVAEEIGKMLWALIEKLGGGRRLIPEA